MTPLTTRSLLSQNRTAELNADDVVAPRRLGGGLVRATAMLVRVRRLASALEESKSWRVSLIYVGASPSVGRDASDRWGSQSLPVVLLLRVSLRSLISYVYL